MDLSRVTSAPREQIRQRIEGETPGLSGFRAHALTDLEKKREKASNWAAAVGHVNPRRGRFYDPLVQVVKRLMARALRWYSDPQQRLNQAQLEALAEIQQLFAGQTADMSVLTHTLAQAQETAVQAQNAAQGALRELEAQRAEASAGAGASAATGAGEIQCLREAFAEQLGEQKRSLETRIASNIAELRAKVESIDHHLIENVKWLNASLNKMQETFWADLARLREKQGERLEQELRLIRQRLARTATAWNTAPEAPAGVPGSEWAAPLATPDSGPAHAVVPEFDYAQFEDRFRGTEPEVRQRQATYLPLFRDHAPVLDVACGRGELLAFLAQHGLEARGVDVAPDMVARCREQGLQVECADAFDYLATLPDDSLGAVFSAQFLEHLQPPQYIRLIQLAHQKLREGGLLLLETQNPECLVTLSRNFYLDPTHLRPVPPEQLRFLMEEAGFCELATYYLSPVPDRFPALPLFNDPSFNPLFQRWDHAAKRFNEVYFGHQDYAVAGVKVSSPPALSAPEARQDKRVEASEVTEAGEKELGERNKNG